MINNKLIERIDSSVDGSSDESGIDILEDCKAEIKRLSAESIRLKTACICNEDRISQILGKALGFPWYKDDLKNFPEATEADGVCTGHFVAEDLANMIAERIRALEAKPVAEIAHIERDKQPHFR